MYILAIASYLVRLVGSSCGDLALLARRKLGEVAVVVTLPAVAKWLVARGLTDALAQGQETHILW